MERWILPPAVVRFSQTGALSVGFTPSAQPAQSSLGGPAIGLGLAYRQTTGADNIAIVGNGGVLGSVGVGDLVSQAGNWFYLELSESYLGSNQYSLTGRMYNSSSTGALGTLIGSITRTTTHSILAGDPTAYLYMGTNGSPNVRTIDNFTSSVTPIPEASSVSLMIGGVAVLFVLLARYRRLHNRADEHPSY